MSNESYDLYLTTLSPIHIGSGKSYGCCEFVPARAKVNGEIKRILKRVNLTKYYSGLSDDKKDSFLASLTNSGFELKQFDNKIKKDYVRYQCIDNSMVNSIKDVEEHIKTSDKLYIPGSSIKGAIRNSILYSKLNLNHKMNYELKKIIDMENKNLNSFMKNLNFTDTFNGIKEPTIYGVESIGTKRNTFTFLETIDKGSILKFKYYNSANPKLNKKIFDYNIDDIFKCSYEFSMDLFDEEIRFAEENGFNNLEKFYNNIYNLNSVDCPFIRLGQGSGVLAVSQILNIKNSRNPNEFKEFRNHNRIGKNYRYDFPKTKKLIVNSDMPLGWVQLSRDD